jgi:hypothetical protein
LKTLAKLIIALYRRVLALYPAPFRVEFGEEMQETFIQSVLKQQESRKLVAFCLRELVDLPGALLHQYGEYCLHLFQGGSMITQNEFTAPSSRSEALLGALPFLAFGLVSMLGRLDLHIHDGYFDLGFYFLVLVGLLVGWVKKFPRWAYGYLGWALVFAWWWIGARTNGLNLFGYIFAYNESWGWWIWLPLGIVALIALLWTRSFRPIKHFFLGIWNDWTRLSFFMFTFPAWFLLIYDENHHPYLMLFMLGSTLTLGLGAYLFLRSTNPIQRMVALLGSLMVAVAINWICDSTWDFAAYYHLPASTDPWYMTVMHWAMVIAMIAAFLFSPAIISLLRGKKRPNIA